MRKRLVLTAAGIAICGLFGPANRVNGQGVDPAQVTANVAQGFGAQWQVTKTVTTPEIPPRLDFFLVVDNTGSYVDDLPTIKAKALSLCNTIKVAVPDSQFGLATFRDYPYINWGYETLGDYAYKLNKDLTADCNEWAAAVALMVANGGGDTPESQYEALYQLATGKGRDVGDPGPSLGDIEPGQGGSFRTGSSRVVAITTDAPFHTPGDSNCTVPSPCPFPYPGPSRDVTVNALTSAGIRVVAIKAPGSGLEMDDLATATGGAVVFTNNTSDEIAEAILEGLGNVSVDVAMTTDCLFPISATFDPTSQTVVSGDQAQFTETISVAAPAKPGLYTCTDTVSISGEPTYYERKSITVVKAFCVEGPNPAGKVPKAPGRGGQGQNQDGFYTIGANPAGFQVYLMDNGTGTIFGPFATPTNIKYTEANGAVPSMTAGAGVVQWHIKGQGDATVMFTDDFGNVTTAECLVPPPPK